MVNLVRDSGVDQGRSTNLFDIVGFCIFLRGSDLLRHQNTCSKCQPRTNSVLTPPTGVIPTKDSPQTLNGAGISYLQLPSIGSREPRAIPADAIPCLMSLASGSRLDRHFT
ncbi:Uncharacterized protein HZ326_11902 [Fusarium oxysporum f. sp. albedinis]|nr:Uncharacterized protein HZ326_11902 [Fusarium oxysporum f. sp. albedinis]